MPDRSSLTAGVAALALCAVTSGALADDRDSVWRLFVADHTEAVIHAIDAEDGAVLARFETKSPATLHATASGRTVFAVEREGDRVSTIATGIVLDDHGDHGDLTLSEPGLLGGGIEGDRPVHFVDHDSRIALFFDGEGVARIVGEDDMRNEEVTVQEVTAEAPHHGVAIPMRGHILLSVPDANDPGEPPVGLVVLDSSNTQVGEIYDCPGLHGEAASGRLVAIGCEDGLLIVREGAEPEISHLPYPASFPDGKVGTLVGGKALQYFLGNYGTEAVVLVDPDDAKTPYRLVELPVRRVHFAIDPIRAKYAYVFTEDGRLHRLDVLSGVLDAVLDLTEPYSMDGHWSDPRPRIAVTDDAVIVTDPRGGRLHVVDAERFEKTGEIAVDGLPFNIVAVGASGATH